MASRIQARYGFNDTSISRCAAFPTRHIPFFRCLREPKEIETMFQTQLKATFTLFIYMLALAPPAMLGHAAPPPKAPVVATPDFSMSVTPTFSTRKRGTGMLWNISVTALNGFNGTVHFKVTGLFPGAVMGAGDFPTPVTGSGTSSFGIETQRPPITPQGTFKLTVTGTSGSLSHSQDVTIQMI